MSSEFGGMETAVVMMALECSMESLMLLDPGLELRWSFGVIEVCFAKESQMMMATCPIPMMALKVMF